MPDAYDLAKMLGEIIEDEKIDGSANRKVSQEEIRNLLRKRHRTARRRLKGPKLPLGEALVQAGVISPSQLEEALQVQAQKGQKIGSVLVQLGYLSEETLLKFLADQYGIETTSLLRTSISEGITNVLPLRVILKHRVLPIKVEERSILLGMENPTDYGAIREIEFLTSKRVNPVVVPAYQMEFALRFFEERGGGLFTGCEFQQALCGPLTMKNLLEHLVSSNGSDMLITAGVVPSLKIRNTLHRSDFPLLNPDQCVAFAKSLMTEEQWEQFLASKELDFAITYEDLGRFRVNVYRQKNTVSLAIRRIPNKIPSLEELGLPQWLEKYVLKPHGLVLVTAPTGQGKTTTIAAMIDLINRKRRCNIISLEDPIEYVHQPLRSNINQREIGTDTHSFSEGLRRVFRQAPDVIVIGEMRDQETFQIALNASSTGHLVLSTMHAGNATSAIEGIINRFPVHLQGEVRQQLAEALLLVFAQRLIPAKGHDALVVAYEKLVSSYRIRNLIRENKVHQIRTQIQAESEDFSSLDVSLIKLIKEGKIEVEDAMIYTENPEYLMDLIQQKSFH